jgi:hypothetical protein
MYAIFFHAHQKIDRVAYRHLRKLTGGAQDFPSIKNILHFEGRNGPDAAKLKKTEMEQQPWHFANPFDVEDTEVEEAVQHHYKELVQALKTKNRERSAFEAAWLAHALVDGLTPAHHYPYEQELEELRGEDRSSRTSLKSRAVVKGDSAHDSLKRTLKIVGPKGLLTTHTAFEAGAFTIMAPLKLTAAYPTRENLASIRKDGLIPYFRHASRDVAMFGMFEQFLRAGWTPKLGRAVRHELAPRMVNIVTLSWYSACVDAGLVKADA